VAQLLFCSNFAKKKSFYMLKLYSEKASAYPGFSPIVLDHLHVGNAGKVPAETKSPKSSIVRSLVCDVISEQYHQLGMSLHGRMDKLRRSETKTVTTGHQLQLCGGPAFLHYKIITAIRLARTLELESGRSVVPIFWLASEDHDFKEISWVNGDNEKFVWAHQLENSKLPVGKFSLDGLEQVVHSWGENGVDLMEAKAVMEELKIAKANGEKYVHLFRRWLELWYGDTELLVIDASHSKLKCAAAELFSHEFTGSGISTSVIKTTESLFEKGFKVGTHVRDVNLFFQKEDGERVGIVQSSDGFVAGDLVMNPDGEDWLDWCKRNAEFLSPGVLLRPLYQELLLNNSHVVLGPGELGYWKRLEGAFFLRGVAMPDLHLRDHVLVLSNEVLLQAAKVGWSIDKGWWSEEEWTRVWLDLNMPSGISNLEDKLTEFKNASVAVASLADPTLERAAFASGAAVDKTHENLLKKIRKAIKRKNAPLLHALSSASHQIFSKGNPQDRYMNFHILSREVGGFYALRNLLLEVQFPSDKVVGELMHVVSNVRKNKEDE